MSPAVKHSRDSIVVEPSPRGGTKPTRADGSTGRVGGRIAIAAAFAVGLVALLVYLPALRGEFLNWDDPDYVVRNPAVQKLNGSTVAWAFTAFHSFNWHPLTWLSHAVDYEIYGDAAWGHHLTSVILHATNAALLSWLLWRLTRALVPSALVATLFALHPLHVESVAWVAERKDVLSTLFWLATLIAYVGYGRRGGAGRYASVLGLFVCGLMCKPMLVTLPFVLLLLDFWPLRRLSPRAVIEKLPLLVLAAASGVVTLVAQRGGGSTLTLNQLDLGYRAANALFSYGRYLGKTFWPAVLVPYYPYETSGGTRSVWILVGVAALLAAVSGVAWVLRRRHPYLLFGWLWYLGTLVPVIGIVQVGGQAIADRYTYVPLIGIFVMLAWGSWRPMAGIAARLAFTLAWIGVFVVLALLTVAQIRIWHDSVRLWEHAASVYPSSSIVQDSLADAYRRMQARPEDAERLNRLGNSYYRRGELARAEEFFQRSILALPNQAAAYNHLGMIRTRQDRLDEAIELYRRALSHAPDFTDAMNNLGVALAQRGEIDAAIEHWGRALELDPDDPGTHRNMARALALKGDSAAAAGHFEEVLRLRPGDPGATRGLEELRRDSP